ncbi:Hypothetical predicted protein [Mytilus galloprovincialis]|uniref:Uncharacterized protein n=1 Tax=Mytilus galloprovincialis TaxID=29158 RepID=A0A8B6BK33_MYTGA|nr:Hypothetical predicted protein [Mytilus galloprovincialis]
MVQKRKCDIQGCINTKHGIQRAIIGACIGAIVGLVFFIVLIKFLCCKSKKGTDGTVLPQTGANIAVVGQQQYGQPASGQQPAYGQQ